MSTGFGLSPAGSLAGSEGELVSVRINIEPRRLEELLEALAGVPFPINPQIYHHAAVVYLFPDGSRRTEPATMVEFPAYTGRLDAVEAALGGHGFGKRCFHTVPIMQDIHSEVEREPAPKGAAYTAVLRYKMSA
jgi:hypothetical protein